MVLPKLKCNLWARSLVLCASWCLAFGGFGFITAYPSSWPQLAIYSWVVAVVLGIFFWPVQKLGRILIVVQNFYVDAVLCFGLGIWPCFELPSFLGGLCLGIAGIIFIVAGARGEKGLSLDNLAHGKFDSVAPAEK